VSPSANALEHEAFEVCILGEEAWEIAEESGWHGQEHTSGCTGCTRQRRWKMQGREIPRDPMPGGPDPDWGFHPKPPSCVRIIRGMMTA
jgi:hypothetical protein